MVSHGARVERCDEWFCEAVWDGDYQSGDFDQTDIVAGSGGRIRDAAVTFVSSGSTVDRLQSVETPDATWISNSLPCLLALTDSNVDLTYPNYFDDFYSIVRGIEAHKRSLATSAGEVTLTYFHNLVWDGQRLTRVAKPRPKRDFASYAGYVGFLQSSLQALSQNMRDPRRTYPYRMLGTLSSGYDSPAVTALARTAGLEEVMSFDRCSRGEDDSGERIAQYLGVRSVPVPLAQWRAELLPEIPFLSSNAMGEEVRFKAAEPLLAGRVLLTGYHGDKIWDLHTEEVGPDIRRKDPSGLALTEYRLWSGFIHCPLPFFGARELADVVRISRSQEMVPWDVGGDYSRPICRRIVEESGVPRELFGVRKRQSSVILSNSAEFLTPESARDLARWLKDRRHEWTKRRRRSPRLSLAMERISFRATQGMSAWAERQPGLWRVAVPLARWRSGLRRAAFPWALEHAMQRYRRPPG